MVITPKSAAKFVSKHRVAIAVVATVILMSKANRNAVQDYEDFLTVNYLHENFDAFLAKA